MSLEFLNKLLYQNNKCVFLTEVNLFSFDVFMFILNAIVPNFDIIHNRKTSTNIFTIMK